MKKAVIIFISVFLLSAFAGCAHSFDMPRQPVRDDLIRVAILDDVESFTLSMKGHYTVTDLKSNAVLLEGKKLNDAKVAYFSTGLWIGDKDIQVTRIAVSVKKDASIFVNKRCYRGEIDIIKKPNDRFLVINRINVEDYIRGVLYHEISDKWPIEAIKAQAIAARTYALYVAQERKAQDFDVTSDIYSQVYGGATSEKWKTDKAVALTKGQVLTYKGRLFPTYYHATCAGATEDASNLWKINMAPLKGGVKCDFCILSPHYHWENQMKLSEMSGLLEKAGHKVGAITKITPHEPNASGRRTYVTIAGSLATVKLSGKDFRAIIGPNVLRSTNFDVEIKKDKAVFEGLGWGHGVGMCQWGSFGMSLKGYSAQAILQFYYPGSQITKSSN